MVFRGFGQKPMFGHNGGKGVQKCPKICPHGLWMTPNFGLHYHKFYLMKFFIIVSLYFVSCNVHNDFPEALVSLYSIIAKL